MSMFVKHEVPRPAGTKLALFLGILWAVSLGVIWIAYRGDGDHTGGFFHFVARFHVLIVHFPIGVIFLATMVEFLAYFTAFSHLRKSMPFILWISFLGSIGATVVGYLLMTVESFSGRAMELHLYFGLAVVVFCLFALLFCLLEKRLLTGAALVGAAFSTAASGHFGGAMVHEPSYLTEFAPAALKPALLIGLSHHEPKTDGSVVATKEPTEIPIGERVVYTDFISPILDKTCNECHNENKIKGKLRMDTYETLMSGAEGSDFPTVVPGDPEKSELLVRVHLPDDEDEFMPPKGDPLKPSEIEMLKLWIKAGASTETTVAQLGDDPAIAATALAVALIHAGGEEVEGDTALAAAKPVWDTYSAEEQAKRITEANEAADKYHFSIMPISAEDARLRVNVINAAKEFGDDQIKLLLPVADRIVWLDLARSQITDEAMKTVRQMPELERLHLENTQVTDTGIAEIATLSKLEYLNLYGTKVSDAVFETFAKLPSLKKVYTWQTAVDPAAAKAFEKSINLEINTGVDASTAAASTPETSEKIPAEAKPATPVPDPAKPAEVKPTTPAPGPAPIPAKPAPAKPATPAPAKPAETTPATPAPAKPAETKPATPAPAKPAETKPATPAPAKPVETKPATPAPAKPVETKPATPAPAKPAETKPATPAPAKPVETKPATPIPAPPIPNSPVEKKNA
jgi:hypothetical protein